MPDVATTSRIDELFCCQGARYWVECVAFAPDGQAVATGSGQPLDAQQGDPDFTIRLWDVKTGQELRRFPGHAHWVTSVAFAPDGRRLLSGGFDHTVRLRDAATGTALHRSPGHPRPPPGPARRPARRPVL